MWFGAIMAAGLFLVLGFYLLFAGGDSVLFAVMGFGMAAIVATSVPVSTRLTFDAHSRSLTFVTISLLGWPRRREHTATFSQVARVEHRPGLWGRNQVVELATEPGLRLNLQFGTRQSDAARVAGKILEFLGNDAPGLRSPQAVHTSAVEETYSAMHQQLRSWGLWMLVMGGAQMVAAQSFSPWGALLIGVGLASFYFRQAAMFVIYAVTVSWAGLSNLLYGEVVWKGFALLQAFWAFQLFQHFFRFHRAQRARVDQLSMGSVSPDLPPERAAIVFPWAGLFLGVVGFFGLAGVLFVAFIGPLLFGGQVFPEALGYVESAAVISGILGFALGLASVLSDYNPKLSAWAGIVAGGLTLMVELGLSLIGLLF